VPAEHDTGDVDVVDGHFEPAGHKSQEVTRPVELENFPAPHGTQAVDDEDD
jgi:hypothetical protein